MSDPELEERLDQLTAQITELISVVSSVVVSLDNRISKLEQDKSPFQPKTKSDYS